MRSKKKEPYPENICHLHVRECKRKDKNNKTLRSQEYENRNNTQYLDNTCEHFFKSDLGCNGLKKSRYIE